MTRDAASERDVHGFRLPSEVNVISFQEVARHAQRVNSAGQSEGAHSHHMHAVVLADAVGDRASNLACLALLCHLNLNSLA